MRVTPLSDARHRPRRIAVGTFDGVHLGHREVIRGADTVLTFEPHPAAVVAPGGAPLLLTPLERKAELIGELGVEEIVVIAFDRAFAGRSPQAFIDDVLVGTLGATHVSVGENFTFGARAKGDPALLAADGRFETRVVPLLEIDGEIVSSSHVRALVQAGDVAEAERVLGRPFDVAGPVVHGDERGRELGFPTANLVPAPGFVAPGHGVYACLVEVGGTWVPAATNVGVRPTFETGRGELIEAYLIDWRGDLYDQVIRVAFLERLRGERRFDSADALVEQMHADVRDALATVSSRT